MTSIRKIKQDITRVRKETDALLVAVIDEISKADKGTLAQVEPHLSAALGDARREIRETKTERGLPLGPDTSIVDPEELQRRFDEYEKGR